MTSRVHKLIGEEFDVIVIGAGMGGLTTAALLATRGKRVLVVESHYAAGGNATVFRRKGYEFDVGLHYVGGCHPSGVIPRIMRAAGAGEVEWQELAPDGFDTLVFPDRVFRIPKGIDAFRARLLEAFPREARGIERYARMLRELSRLQDTLGNAATTAWAIARSWMVLRYARSTFAELLASCTDNPELIAILAGQAGDYALPPSRASALVGAGVTMQYLQGAYVPRGGSQVLSGRLVDTIESHGGQILLRATARRIVVHRGRVVGIEIESKHVGHRFLRANTVVSNADWKRTMLELVGPSHLPASTIARVERAEMSPALGVLYLGIRRDLGAEGHPATNYWIHPSYDCEAACAAAARGCMLDEPVVYASIASLKDPGNRRLCPPGMTNLQLMSVVPSSARAWGVTEQALRDGTYGGSPVYRRNKERLTAALLRVASRVLPGIEGQVVYQEMATPLTHTRFTGSTGGTSYGLALTPKQFLGHRPSATTDIRGLLLAGASCRAGHGIAGVMVSGVLAAREIVGGGLVREIFGERNAAGPGNKADDDSEWRAVGVPTTQTVLPATDAGHSTV